MIALAIMNEQGLEADCVLSRWSSPHDGFSGARRRSLLARAILRKMLAQATGTSSGDWMFVVDRSGAPRVRNVGGISGYSVSLAHSAGLVACAMSDSGNIGIDIEVHRPTRNFIGIAAAAFGSEERRQVEMGGAAAFYRIWTLKEAIAKACGIGFARVADRVDRVAQTANGFWSAEFEGASWRLAHTNPARDVSLAVALKTSACSGPSA